MMLCHEESESESPRRRGKKGLQERVRTTATHDQLEDSIKCGLFCIDDNICIQKVRLYVGGKFP